MSKVKEVIVITGGSAGYGKATAEIFVKNGYNVIITGRNEERLHAAAKEVGAEAFRADATSPKDWDALCEHVMKKYNRIDLLLNNAGGGVAIKETADLTVDEIDRTIKLNLNSCIYGCRVFAPIFKKQGFGTIINVSSICAKEAWPAWTVYASAKWGVLGFTKGLTTELQPYGIRVTCLLPGAGDTDFDRAANFTGRGSIPGLKADNIAESIYAVYTLPKNTWVEEITVWGNDQIVVPLSR